ncbi:MAG: NAD-dependent epimerase/dehydratase family protein [Deltaproteobacteria bacterium]|nr:NAD-dependent epimerase/dehydratase family protein [Deltaproteobacteria bacterium]
MRWLVTGGTGFVGGAVIRRLLTEGEQVVALCRDARVAHGLERAGAEVVEGDLGSPRRIERAARGAAVVVHAAGLTQRRSSLRALGWVNVAGAENVLRASRAAHVRRLVHVSCADVTLNTRPRVGWNEDQALSHAPLGAYAQTKLAAEELMIGGGRDGLETMALRPAWIWGAGDESVLPALAREVLDGGLAIVGKGERLLGTTHVDNLAEAVLRAGTRPEASGGVYHVVDAEMVLAGDFFHDIAQALGGSTRSLGGIRRALWRARWDLRRGRSGLLPEEVALRGLATSLDQRRVIRDLGYAPPVSMADGMAELREWIDAEGGAEALAERVRAPAQDDHVDAQVQMADDVPPR